MAKGGKRVGAGRPRGSKDGTYCARTWAGKAWKDSDCDEKLKAVLNCGDPRVIAMVLMKLAELIHGKPMQPTEVSGPGGGAVPIQLVNHIPRPERGA
jgi:hypothetical protein